MDNKGINLIALIIMIVVMIIIAGIAINNSTGSYEQALTAKAREERNQMAKAVGLRFGNYQINKVASPIVGDVIPEEYLNKPTDEEIISSTKDYLVTMFRKEGKLVTDDEMNNHTTEKEIEKFLKDNINDMEYTRVLRHANIVELEVDSISIQSEFLVNYYSQDVVGPIQ